MNGQSEESRAVNVEVERVVSAARDALTDEMVTRLASTAGDAVELMDQVNRAGLARAIPALAQMVNNGDLERLSQVARLYSSAQDALTDEMVTRLSQAVGDGLALLDQVNRAGLDRAIPALAEMVNNGDLNRLVKLVRVYGSAEDASDRRDGEPPHRHRRQRAVAARPLQPRRCRARRQDARGAAGKRRAGTTRDDAAATCRSARDGAGGAAVDRRGGDRESGGRRRPPAASAGSGT